MPTQQEISTARPYAGTPAADRQADRRRRLLDAALDLLGTGNALTVRSATAQAGLNPRYFYESFATTDDLVVALFDELVARAVEAVGAAVTPTTKSGAARAEAAVRAMIEATTSDPRVARVLYQVGLENPDLLRRRLDALRSIAALTAPDERSRAERDFIAGGVLQLILSWMAGEIDGGPEELSAVCVDLALRVSRRTKR